MKLFMVEPEVAGEIGERTIYENYDAIINNGERPQISYLHFVLMGWLGDDILEVTPCFMVSEKLKNVIEESTLTGYAFQDIDISVSEDYSEMYPDRELPHFYRLLPQGVVKVEDETYYAWNNMDFCVTEKFYLVLSENAMKIIRDYQLDNADIRELCPKEG